MKSTYPTDEQLAMLSKAGWRKCHGGRFWQSPYHKEMYFSPRKAWAIEAEYGKA